jgi:hypothetical protein
VRTLEFLFRPRSVAVIGAFTLRGLVAELAERGLDVDDRTVWNFVHREGLSFKKGHCHMGHPIIAVSASSADSVAIREGTPADSHHRRLINDLLCWIGRFAEDDGDLRR